MKDEGQSEDMRRGRDICQRTFRFAVDLVRLCRAMEGQPGVSRELARQLLRSGTSIGANVEEAQAGQSRADFIFKYAIARKEARETVYWLRLLQEGNLVQGEGVDVLLDESQQLVRILTAIIKSAEGKS